jgi:hypothetical protein
MWIRAGNNAGGEHRLINSDHVSSMVAATQASVWRIQFFGDWSTSVYSITSYGTESDAQQAADDLVKALTAPQIVET